MPTLYLHDFERASQNLLEQFRSFHVADVANALGARAVADPGIRAVWGTRLFGSALTVKIPPKDNFGANAAAALVEPGDVVVIDASGDPMCACVGGLIARMAQSRGAAGFVVDGAVRDLEDFEALGIPVYARSVSACRSTKAGPATIGDSVRIGGVEVHSGDLVLGDRDGVAFVHASDAESTLVELEHAVAFERRLDDLSALTAHFRAILEKADVKRVPRPK